MSLHHDHCPGQARMSNQPRPHHDHCHVATMTTAALAKLAWATNHDHTATLVMLLHHDHCPGQARMSNQPRPHRDHCDVATPRPLPLAKSRNNNPPRPHRDHCHVATYVRTYVHHDYCPGQAHTNNLQRQHRDHCHAATSCPPPWPSSQKQPTTTTPRPLPCCYTTTTALARLA